MRFDSPDDVLGAVDIDNFTCEMFRLPHTFGWLDCRDLAHAGDGEPIQCGEAVHIFDGTTVSAADDVTNAIQRYLDTVGDGWTLDQHVIVMALQRLSPSQEIENIVWYYVPADQPSWQTSGLLDAALRQAEHCDEDTDR